LLLAGINFPKEAVKTITIYSYFHSYKLIL
jgi:hypothetical protein